MFEFNKMIVIYTIAIITLGLYSAYYLIHRPSIILPKLLYPFGIFLIVLGISTYFSIDTHTSIYGYYGRWNGGLISIVAYVSLLFVFIQVFHTMALERLLMASLASSATVILWALPGWFGYDLSCLLFTGELTNSCWTAQFAPHIRMFSTLGQPNWLGAYLAIHLFIGLYFLYKSLSSSRLHRYLMSVYLILNLFALYATKSKSSWYAVALAFSIGAILLFSSRLHKKIRLIVVIGSIVGIVLVTIGILTFGSSLFTQNVPKQLEVTDSFTIRTYVWQGAIDLWKKYPIVGSGPETFAYGYYFTKPIEHNKTSEWDFVYNKAHNEFLNYLATTGIVGFVGYMGIILVVIKLFSDSVDRKQLKNLSPVALPFFLLLSYISILATNFFGFSTSTTQLFFYLIPGMIIVYFLNHKEKQYRISWRTISLECKLQTITILLTSVVLLVQVGRMYYADILYTKAQMQATKENYPSAVGYLRQAMRFQYEHVYEDKLSSYLAHLAFITSFEEGASSSVMDTIDKSKLHNVRALGYSPQSIFYWRSKARNYYLYYQVTQNIQDLITATNAIRYTTQLAPQDVQGYYMTGLFYSVLFSETKNVVYKKEARMYIKQALMLRPQYIEAQELLEEIGVLPDS